MAATVVTGSPGFISIAVTDIHRYRGVLRALSRGGPQHVQFRAGSGCLRGVADDWVELGPSPGAPGPSPETTSIQLWWRASDAQALYETVVAAGVPILAEPFNRPFGRTFAMADPDGYRITVYEKGQPAVWPPRPA